MLIFVIIVVIIMLNLIKIYMQYLFSNIFFFIDNIYNFVDFSYLFYLRFLLNINNNSKYKKKHIFLSKQKMNKLKKFFSVFET